MKLTTVVPLIAASSLPIAATAQSITVVPAAAAAGVTAVPVDSPLALAALALAVAAGAWFVLRNRKHRALFMALCGTAIVASMLWYSPELRAQLGNSFTDPAGETQPIFVAQVTSGGNITGFSPEDFTNAAGVPLKITAIQPPTLTQCFPSGFALLVPPGAPQPAPPSCAVGNTIAPNGVCRVDVESTCRTLAAASQTTLSVSPASLSFDTATPGVLTITNTGTQTAQNVHASIPVSSGMSVQSTTCGASLPPSASCTVELTAAVAEGPTAVDVYGDNAFPSTAQVTVTAASNDVGAYQTLGTCGVLGVQGPGFTLTADASAPLPVGTTMIITGSGIANIGTFTVTGGTANVAVLSPTSRLITLTAPLPAGATIAFRTTLSISVAFTLNGVTTLPGSYVGTGGKPAGNVSSTLILCSAS